MKRPLLIFILALLSVSAIMRPGVPTPVQAADQRFGVVFTGSSDTTVAHALSLSGAFSWFDFNDTGANPSGYNKAILVRSNVQLTQAQLQSMAAHAIPGAYWIIGNEPNVAGQDDIDPAIYAQRYKYYHDTISAIDSTAKFVAGNVLNWSTTCPPPDCSFNLGKTYIQDVIQQYQTQNNGAFPPVDVWGIHAYIIDWGNLPMVDWQQATTEIADFRTYLATLPSEASKPIWVTEFGVIWGYPGRQFDASINKWVPTGAFAQVQVNTYLNQFVGWLKDNASSKNIQKWFLYVAYGYPEPYSTTFAGIGLLDGPTDSANLTTSGTVYRDLAGGALPTPTPSPTPGPPVPGGGGGGGGGTSNPTATSVPTATRTATPTPVAPPPSAGSATAPVGPDGGQVAVGGGSTTDGGLTTVIVPGTWPDIVQVTSTLDRIMPTDVAPPSGGQLLNMTIEVKTSEPVNLAKAMGLQVNLTASDLGGKSLQDIQGGVIMNGKVEPRPTRIVDAAQGIIWIDLDHLTKFTLFAVAKPGPTLTSPPSDVSLSGLGTNLTWMSPVGTTQYAIQVIPFAFDGPGIDLVRNVDSSFTVNPPNFGGADPNYVMLPDMSYIWRVRTTTVNKPPNELSESDWTSWSLGTFRTAIKTSDTISQITPAFGVMITTQTPTLVWDNTEKSIFYYEVQVSKDSSFGTGAFLYWELRHGAVTNPMNSYTIPSQFPLEKNTTYFWRVRPRVQGNGTPLAWTPASSFTVGQ